MQGNVARNITNLGRALILAAVLALFFVTAAAAVGVLDLAWTEPTTNTDGSQLTDLVSYRVYVGASSGPCSGSLFLEVQSSTSTPTGMEVTYHLTGLNIGETYHVQVTALSASGFESDCSNEATGSAVLETPPGAATLVSPSGPINTRTPTFTWNAVSTATWYYLWVNDSTSAKVTQCYTAAQAGCGGGTGTCRVTPSTALAQGVGQWWIQTYNAAGNGPWSSVGNFTVSTP